MTPSTPQKRKERTLHAQLAQVEGLAARQPVLMVWEDVHWSDLFRLPARTRTTPSAAVAMVEAVHSAREFLIRGATSHT